MKNYLKSINVLLVEDEPEIQKNLKEILEYFFANVYIANDGIEALKSIRSNNVHVIFTDYEMPNMNGYELIKEIRSFDKKIPITIISNHDDKEKLQACIPLKLSGYIFKPLSYDDLKKHLNKLFANMIEDGTLKHNFSDTHSFCFATNTLSEKQQTYKLTKLECRFLEYMISLDGKIATFYNLYEYLYEFKPSEATVKNLIYRLKTKYNFNYIKNIKEVGYILVNDE